MGVATTGCAPPSTLFSDFPDTEMDRLRSPLEIVTVCEAASPPSALKENSWVPGSTGSDRPFRCDVRSWPSIFTCTSTNGSPCVFVTESTTDGRTEDSWLLLIVHCSNSVLPHEALAHLRNS